MGAHHLDSLDLFHYETDDGRGLRLALDFLTPYLTDHQTWDFWPGEPFAREPAVYYVLLRSAAVDYHDPTLLEAADQLGFQTMWSVNLTHPEMAVLETLRIGDANLDGVFNAADLVGVFQAGKYERDVQAGWADGDWNRDRRFNSGDLIAAFARGGYESPVSSDIAFQVPEPQGHWLPAVGWIPWLLKARRHRRQVLR